MVHNFDVTKSLQQLENKDWGEPNYSSHLVETCHRLRRKPVGEFTVEDLRIMIGQDIGLPYLIPLALVVLRDEPLADGDFYKGDLLRAVLKVRHDFWQENPDLWTQLNSIAQGVEQHIEWLQKTFLPSIEKFRYEPFK